MDVVRRRRPAATRAVLPFAIAVFLVAGGVLAFRLLAHPAAEVPIVDRSTLVFDVARRGTLVQTVTASGVLVPGHLQVVAAPNDGIVQNISVRSGSVVHAGTPVATLANPDLEAAVVDIAAQLAAARADVRSVKENAVASHLDLLAALGAAVSEAKRSNEQARADETLHAQGEIADVPYHIAEIAATGDRDMVDTAGRKIEVDAATSVARIASSQAHAEELAAELSAKRAQVAALAIRSTVDGIVQNVTVDPGARLANGTEIATIAGQRDLKATLQVAEADLRGVGVGMPARIEVEGAATVAGSVARIAPTAQNGTIGVDVTLASIPPGARPSQNVDGSIVISRIPQAISIARPPNANDDSTVWLYRVVANGTRALRTQVALGRGSLARVRVRSGITPGETVIVSDTSSLDAPALQLR